METVKAVIKSRRPTNPETVKILDYFYNDKNEISLMFIYKKARYTQFIQNKITDEYDIETTLGDRYIVINNNVYFIDDASDIQGIFNYY